MCCYDSVMVADESNLQTTRSAKDWNQVLWLSTQQNSNLARVCFSIIPDGQNFPHLLQSLLQTYAFFFFNKIIA